MKKIFSDNNSLAQKTCSDSPKKQERKGSLSSGTESLSVTNPKIQDPLKKNQKTKRVIEALLFSSSEPLSIRKMQEIVEDNFPLTEHEIKIALMTLKEEYEKEQRSFEVVQIAGGFATRTRTEFSPFIERLRGRREEKLSRASNEVLAIIAHLQPVTRGTIEKIRGVDSSGTLSALIEKGMVEMVGRLDSPGKPAQYGITQRFLTTMGLNDITELKSVSQAMEDSVLS